MKKITIVVSVVVLCVFSGLFIKHQIEVKAEKKKFEAINHWLNDESNKVATANPASEQTEDTYCSRNSVKFGQGKRSCGATEYIIFPNMRSTSEDIAVLEASVKTIAWQQPEERAPDATTNELKVYHFYQQGFSCYSVLYDNTHISKYALPMNYNGEQDGLLLVMGCSGPAMADYFPSRD